ncbi:SH3 domain-containing protein [Acidipila sp. EB88]|uniref:SH3 domain-containing protein n=1 Tax=Acidipila sp. EB88 TaxID=2305226 RepID=UPI000F5E8DDE|nr:hypothetical protein [Acidipila sp. EB88]RRA47563.1 hypothetical protein D1Y84_03870 [Acidipila sp. EB88]
MLGSLALVGTGCGRVRHLRAQNQVYVVSKGTFLRDRLAAVSNHVADIHNGEKLTVLQHDRRFYQVRTPDGKVGWLEEHAVIDQGEYDKFEALKTAHAKDPVVASAILRDDIFLHLTPGRKTEHLYLLPANDKLEVLRRASVEKPLPPQQMLAPKSLKPRAARPARPVRPAAEKKKEQGGSTVWAMAPPHPDKYTAPDLDPEAPWMAAPMEDWSLVRDNQGRVGWILSRAMDVDIPDEVVQYSEGRKIVGAYLLNTVMDNGEPPERHIGPEEAKRNAERAAKHAALLRRHPDADADKPAAPEKPAPVPHPVGQYVTVTTEYKDGLPFDWDQVRVFIWNRARHRYETAYRLREQQGYLPVIVGKEQVDKVGEEPTFTIRTSSDGAVTQDDGGSFHPKNVTVTQYRLEGNIVRRDTPLPVRPGDAAAVGGAVAGAAAAGAHSAPAGAVVPGTGNRAGAGGAHKGRAVRARHSAAHPLVRGHHPKHR